MTDGDKGVIAYHFTSDTLRDGRPIPAIGEKLEHEGEAFMCKSGLHASEHPFDALDHAPGPKLHRVLMGKVVDSEDDKLVGRERTILASIDATELLREFARWCALQVIDQWDAPAVVREYLETGDETLRLAARATARQSAHAGARSAASASALDTVHAEAWLAAWAAARDAGWDAGWAEARAEARTAARAAQRERFAEMVEAAFAAE